VEGKSPDGTITSHGFLVKIELMFSRFSLEPIEVIEIPKDKEEEIKEILKEEEILERIKEEAGSIFEIIE